MAGRSNLHTRTLLAAASAVLFLASLASAGAAEVSRSPFQKSALSNCTDSGLKTCRYTFPKVATKRRMDIQFVSCAVRTLKSDPAYVSSAFLGVNDAFDFPQLHLAWQSRGTGDFQTLTISQPVVFSIGAGDAAQIKFEFTGFLSAIQSCNISGELITLE
jgi:hypothetical protein